MMQLYLFAGSVGVFTALAACTDMRMRRIPNYLTVPAAALGLAYHTLAPGGMGPLFALGGFAVGFLLLLAPWLFGGGSKSPEQGMAAESNTQDTAVDRPATVIGEGGSGGALAIGVADHLMMLQYSTYSVISPEGCASILWKDAEKAPLAASDPFRFSGAEPADRRDRRRGRVAGWSGQGRTSRRADPVSLGRTVRARPDASRPPGSWPRDAVQSRGFTREPGQSAQPDRALSRGAQASRRLSFPRHP